jgi:hypothetical protein
VVFYVQLQWRSWLMDQVSSDTHLALPYFCTGLRKLEQQNKSAWVPSCANVPQLQALQHVQRPAPAPCATTAPSIGGGGGGGHAAPGGAPTGNGNPAPFRVRIRNPARRHEFTGNSPLATHMRTIRVAEALVLGGDPPSVVRSGEPKFMCVSWHFKGVCFEDCYRDHSTSSDSEAEEFMGWCQVAYA